MSIVQPENLTETALGEQLGQAIIQRVMINVKHFMNEEPTDLSNWLVQITDAIREAGTLEKGFKHVRAVLLAVVKSKWDSLPYDLRRAYSLRFEVYAAAVAPDVSIRTIENHIRAVETFILKGIKPSKAVEVVERQPDGHPIIQDGVPKTHFISFDPLETDISKLVALRSVAENGTITPKLWEMATDKFYTYEDIRAEMFSSKSKEAGIDPVLSFRMLGPVLIAQENGKEALVIGEDGIHWEAYYDDKHRDHDLVKRAVDKLCRCLSVTLDEKVIELLERRRNTQWERRIR